MKWGLLLILLLLPIVTASEISSYVNDNAGVIDAAYRTDIETMLASVHDTAQIAVVTVNSLEGRDIESYSLELAQGNLGDDTNNGMLLLVAVEDRKYRFEVGRGLEGTLNDAKVGRIGRQYLVPQFRREEYGAGIYDALHAVVLELDPEITPQATVGFDTEYYISSMVIKFVAYLIFFLVFLGFSVRRRNYRNDQFFDSAMMAGLLLGGRGRGGSSFGGGFRGFGGGGFGGGGASGGW